MTFNKTQNEIISALRTTNGIRWAELKRIVVDNKEICSERIFRETLNELVQSEIVFKYEITAQHIEYYLQEKIEDPQKSLDEAFKRHSSQFDFLINSIEKHRNKLSTTDLATLIVVIWKMLSNLEFSIIISGVIQNKPKMLQGKDFLKHRKKLIDIILKSKTEEEKIRLFDYMERLLRWETYQFGETMKKELTDKQIPWFESEKTS